MRRLSALLPLLAAAACGGGAPTPSTAPPDPMAFERWARDAPFAGLETPRQFEQRFGRPVDRQAVPQENRHVRGQTDSVLTLTYPGRLVARFYAITGGRTLPMSVEVRSSGILTEPVDVGSRWSAVPAAFGPPDGERDGQPFYVCDCGGPEEPVLFLVSGGRVEAIRFVYYVD